MVCLQQWHAKEVESVSLATSHEAPLHQGQQTFEESIHQGQQTVEALAIKNFIQKEAVRCWWLAEFCKSYRYWL